MITISGAGYDTEDAIKRSHGLLEVMEDELGQRPFLAGDKPTVADIAAYTAGVSA
ncbi:glutathione S-transferase C-terminal domain-containing protein [Pseudomonas sp. DP16D-R1]|uniref:glutathione S-transferase C-terminal domain-containing protein n=1 Tax=Pseudomonas sp. DP16D-R1 TaxID=2075551 RepID=UPI000CD04C5E|nr:glutathione S-transferase C-terminal domain-containing protein [Pseudomonas sp. DP16D-R1]POA75938.1 hypothetical protein C1890_22470 [Pseudomonas sp. DP16D-R1]